MLKLLRFQNLGLFEDAELAFDAGMSVLTGDSGAGKSLVLSGLTLLAGSQRARLRPRPGRSAGFVEAEFELTAAGFTQLRERLAEEGLDDGDHLVLARRIQQNGRTRAFVQGQQVSRSLIEEIGTHLFEFCDQGQSHGLKAPAAQLEALDDFLGLGEERRALRAQYERLSCLDADYAQLSAERADNERRLEFVEFQIDELASCALSDFDALRAQLEAEQNAEATCLLLGQCLDELSGGPQSALGRLHHIQKQLENARWAGDPEVHESLCHTTNQLLSDLSHFSEECRTVRGGLVVPSTQEKAQLEQEVEKVTAVARKHRLTPEQLVLRSTELERLRDDLLERGRRRSELEGQLELARREADSSAAQLHRRRLQGASRFDSLVSAELAALGLPGARLETHLATGNLGPTGTSQISVGFCAHAGGTPLPLGRVASGGEVARVLLAMRLALGARSQLLCFDEIDAGTGGDIATQVGRALKRASRGGQVLAVTHWPQVASLADAHLLVVKQDASGEPTSSLEVLSDERRLPELARMLGGNRETAQKHAERLRLSAA